MERRLHPCDKVTVQRGAAGATGDLDHKTPPGRERAAHPEQIRAASQHVHREHPRSEKDGVARERGCPAERLLRCSIASPYVPAFEPCDVQARVALCPHREPQDVCRSGRLAAGPGQRQGGDAARRHLFLPDGIARGPLTVTSKNVASDDQGIDSKPFPALDHRKRSRRTSFVARDRPLGAEWRVRDDVDVRTPSGEFGLDHAPERDLAEVTCVEGSKQPDSRPLSGTVHVMPPCRRRIGQRPHVSGMAQGTRAADG